jgi:hypothetical protein
MIVVMRPTGPGKVELYPKVGNETHALLYNFDIDGEALKREHTRFLDTQVIPILVGGGHVAITGMCSRSGSDAYNQRLSDRRAKRVVDHVGHWTLLSRVYQSAPTFAAHGYGEALAAVAGAKDGSEDEMHRAVYVIVSPKPIPKPVPPKQLPEPQQPQVLWRTEELSLRADQLELPLYKRLRGNLFLTQGSCEHIRWHFTASNLSLTIDPKGKPPVFMGDIKALGANLIYDPKIYEPGAMWSNKRFDMEMMGQSITITIERALPAPLSATYNPVKPHGIEVRGRDIRFTLRQLGGGELGVVSGFGHFRQSKYITGSCPDIDGTIA